MFYVAADNKTELKSILEVIGQNETIRSLIKDFRFTYRNERITDTKKSEVLKLTLSDSTQALTLAKRIEKLGNNRLVKVEASNCRTLQDIERTVYSRQRWLRLYRFMMSQQRFLDLENHMLHPQDTKTSYGVDPIVDFSSIWTNACRGYSTTQYTAFEG